MRCLAVLAAAAVLGGARLLSAACDPGSEPDRTDIATARAAVDTSCNCATAASHGEYVRCARSTARASLQNPACMGAVVRCASRSTCGRPGTVACCSTSPSGTTRCGIRRGTLCASTATYQRCASDVPSCCDACTSTGCATTTTTLPCGDNGHPCCAGGACNVPFMCVNGTCVACGQTGGACCPVPGADRPCFTPSNLCCNGFCLPSPCP